MLAPAQFVCPGEMSSGDNIRIVFGLAPRVAERQSQGNVEGLTRMEVTFRHVHLSRIQ